MKKKRQWFMCLGMIGVFTASVILSVFGHRKVKAQLNTENAGKITSSWACNRSDEDDHRSRKESSKTTRDRDAGFP